MPVNRTLPRRSTQSPKHTRCRRDVLIMLLVAPPLPDDATVRARTEQHPDVVQARAAVKQEQAALEAAAGTDGLYSWRYEHRLKDARQRLADVEGDQSGEVAAELSGGVLQRGYLWPWRGKGQPWVARATLLRCLPDWTAKDIDTACKRLVDEGHAEPATDSYLRPTTTWAYRLTDEGLHVAEEAEKDADERGSIDDDRRLAELAELLRKRPELASKLSDLVGGEQ